MRNVLTFAVIAIALGGCSNDWDVSMMSRDNGTVYTGKGHEDGMSGSGSGTLTIPIEGRVYSGRVMRTESNDSFGFFTASGDRGESISGTSETIGGAIHVKAILSSPDNHGLRCELSGDGAGHLGGVCVDDQQRIYDALANQK